MTSAVDVGYEYVNARLRGMRSRLLSRAAIEQLLIAPNVEALIGQLDQGEFHSALEQSLVTASGLTAVLRAVQIDHAATLRRIVRFGGETIEAALEILLAPYYRHNITLLIRGVGAGARPERIFPWLLILPPFSEGMLAELGRQATVRGLVDLLAQWDLPSPGLAQRLVAAVAAGSDLRQLVDGFDRAWAEDTAALAAAIPGNDGDLLRLNLAHALDLHNLVLALDLRAVELAKAVAWLPGGVLPAPALAALRTATDGDSMRAVLAEARGGQFWIPALDQWDGSRPVWLQHLWESILYRWRVGLFVRADPLGVGVLIAYLAAKDGEARNLRLVAEAVAGNIGREEARAHLLLSD